MKRLMVIVLALVGLAVLVTRLPRATRFAFLHGTGTVVRQQEAWVTREEDR
jgi:hypothetical protein